MDILNLFVNDSGELKKSVYILGLIVVLFLLNEILSYILKKTKISTEKKRRFLVNMHIFFTLFVIFICFYTYSAELKNLALSLAAVMVAIVLATKELVLNFSGGIFKLFSGSFVIGDTIEIDGKRGNVIDRTLLSTTLLEIGPSENQHQFSGRSIIIPNSLFLTHKMINESFLKSYVLHSFKVVLSPQDNWEKAEEILLERSEFYCSEYFEHAQKALNKLFTKSHLEVPLLKPRVQVVFEDKDKIKLNVRITAPSRTKGTVEQKIIKDFMREFYSA